MSESLYRESATGYDYKKELESLNNLLKLERAKNKLAKALSAFMTGAGWFAATVSILFLCWFVCFRGTAFGIAARHNAEREATTISKQIFGERAEFRIVCTDSIEDDTTIPCFAIRSGKRTVHFQCDDDDPVRNDGCQIINPRDI